MTVSKRQEAGRHEAPGAPASKRKSLIIQRNAVASTYDFFGWIPSAAAMNRPPWPDEDDGRRIKNSIGFGPLI
jgi:hypothetical protein